MGKRLVIKGADFSQNGIPQTLITQWNNGIYDSVTGGFVPQGNDFRGQGNVLGWRGSNPIQGSAGTQWIVTIQFTTRYVISVPGSQVSQTAILQPGTHTIIQTNVGQIKFNAAVSRANSVPAVPENFILANSDSLSGAIVRIQS